MHIFKSSSFFTFFDRQRAKAAMTLSAQVRLKRVQELETKIELRHCDLGSSRLAPFFPGSGSVQAWSAWLISRMPLQAFVNV